TMSTTDRAPCPDIGVWRAWLDNEDPATQPISIEEHLADCPAGQRLVAELREDASDVRDILSVLAPTRLPNAAEVALARERLDWRGRRAAQPAQAVPIRRLEPTPMFFTRLSTPWRVAASGIAAGLVIALLVAFTPQGSSVALAFLSQFRSQQITAIEITPQTQADIYRTLNALGNLGTVQAPGVPSGQARPETAIRAAEQQTHSASLGEAAQTIGKAYFLTPDVSTLPPGMDKTPTVRVMPGTQIRFTFDKKKAEAYLQSSGQKQVNVPDKFDGSSLVVTIPTAVALEYGDRGSKSALVVA